MGAALNLSFKIIHCRLKISESRGNRFWKILFPHLISLEQHGNDAKWSLEREIFAFETNMKDNILVEGGWRERERERESVS